MIDPNVVKLAVGYLDDCFSKQSPATLVGMIMHIDSRNKTMPLVDEINEALSQRPTVRVLRRDRTVMFNASGSDRAITNEDLRYADVQSRREFRTKYGKLDRQDPR